MSAEPAARPGRGFTSGEFYRQCRLWHGYLSAFAFLALVFFAATGILLNHPNWPKVTPPALVESRFALTPQQVSRIRASAEPGRELAALAGAKLKLIGAYREGDLVGDDLYVRLQGVRGTSDLRAHLETGQVEATVERQHLIAVINGLHRAEAAGAAWRFMVDVFGVVLIALSLIGYVLFLSLRFRWRTALALTGASLIVMLGLFLATVS